MRGDHFFHLASREPMSRHIDDVVNPPHDVNVTIGITIATITGQIETGITRPITFNKPIMVAP